MEYTITLTETGYVINADGQAWLVQPFDPAQPGFTPFASTEAAQAHAEAVLVALAASQAPADANTPAEAPNAP